MNNKKDRYQENQDAHQKGWLNLRLGQNLEESCLQSRPNPMKAYTCNFCKRKFFNSQALGGHQNAHRGERDVARSYQSPTTMNSPMNFSVNQSLGVQAHSVVHKSRRDGETTVARLTNNGAEYGVAWVQPYAEGKAVDLKWHGSFYLEQEPSSQPKDPHTLDLNLRL